MQMERITLFTVYYISSPSTSFPSRFARTHFHTFSSSLSFPPSFFPSFPSQSLPQATTNAPILQSGTRDAPSTSTTTHSIAALRRK